MREDRSFSQEKDNVFYDVAPMKYVGWAAYAAGVPKVFADYQSAKITVGKDARWTVLWQKTGDDWLVVHEHFSVPLPSPPPKK